MIYLTASPSRVILVRLGEGGGRYITSALRRCYNVSFANRRGLATLFASVISVTPTRGCDVVVKDRNVT